MTEQPPLPTPAVPYDPHYDHWVWKQVQAAWMAQVRLASLQSPRSDDVDLRDEYPFVIPPSGSAPSAQVRGIWPRSRLQA
jgi:hypothetical protein